jgi:type I restriction enzyme, S subunit
MPEVALKNGWTRVAFGDVVRLSGERSSDPEGQGFERFLGLDHIDPGDLKIRRWGDIADGSTFTTVFRPGQVLFGKRRAYQRKVAVADFGGVCSGDIYVLEPKNARLLSELLPYICQTDGFFDHAVGTSAGSLSPRTNWNSLASYEFALPPLEEQRRIAAVLLASDSLGEAIRRLARSHESLRRAAIDQLTESERWPEATVGDLCRMQNGRPFPGSAYAESGIRLLRPGNLDQSGYLAWGPSKTVCLSEQWEQQAADYVIGPGDVVMNLTAQSLEDGFMGRVCLARPSDRSLLNQRIGRFCNWSGDVLPEYVFRLLQSSRFQRHAIEICEGSKVKHIFWPYIARYVLRVPPLDEQQSLVTILRDVDTLLAEETERARLHGGFHRLLTAAAMDGASTATLMEAHRR